MHRVDEELGATGVGAGVGHREGSGLVADLGSVLVLDAAAALAVIATDDFDGAVLELRSDSGAAGAAAFVAVLLGVRAAELVHEVGDDTVEVNAVVEASVGQVDEVVSGQRLRGDKEFRC